MGVQCGLGVQGRPHYTVRPHMASLSLGFFPSVQWHVNDMDFPEVLRKRGAWCTAPDT